MKGHKIHRNVVPQNDRYLLMTTYNLQEEGGGSKRAAVRPPQGPGQGEGTTPAHRSRSNLTSNAIISDGPDCGCPVWPSIKAGYLAIRRMLHDYIKQKKQDAHLKWHANRNE